MRFGLLGLVVVATPALAHPVGRHVVQHDLALHIDPGRIGLHYETVVPPEIVRSRASDAVVRELVVGLVVTIDGRSQSWTPTETTTEANDHGLRIAIDAALPLEESLDGAPVEVVVSNGNLPETRSVFKTTSSLDPRIRVTDSSLFVLHDGSLARSNEGRVQSEPAARRTTLVLDRPDSWIETLHRTLQVGPFPHPADAASLRWTSPWTTNRSRPWMLGVALVGGLGVSLPAPAQGETPRWVVPVGLAAIAVADLAGPSVFAGPLVAAAMVSALGSVRVPALAWFVLPALVGSLDIWGLGALTVGIQAVSFQLGRRTPSDRSPWAFAAIGLLVGLGQLLRVLGTAA